MGEDEKSVTTRVPKDIIEEADRISDKKGVPRTKAIKILFQMSNGSKVEQKVSNIRDEIERELIMEMDQENIDKLLSSLNLSAIFRKILEKNGSVRKRRLELLEEKMRESITEYMEELNKEREG